MRDKDDDWATPSLRDAARRRATPRLPGEMHLSSPLPPLLSDGERRAGKGCLAGFVGVWLVSVLVSLGILALFIWGLLSLISYLNRH